MAVNFSLKSTIKDGKSQIVVRVQSRKLQIDVKQGTNLYIEPNIWERRNNPSYMRQYRTNESVQRVLNTVDDLFMALTQKIDNGVALDNQMVHDIIYKVSFQREIAQEKREEEERLAAEAYAKRMTFKKYVDQFYADAKAGIRLTEKNTVYTQGSLTSIKQAIDHLRAFEKKEKHTYDFDEIDMDFYRKYLSFLNDENYALNTVGKNINWLKTFMNSAQIEGYHSNVAFKNKMFKGARVEVDTIYLNHDDLEKIRAVDLSGKTPGYELARDIFMVGVWTAQRISDYNNIKPQDINTHVIKKVVEKDDPEHPGQKIEAIESKEVLVVTITQKKTGARVYIPCSTELRNIFEKYHYNIPRLSDQNVNDNMKKIAEWAGLDEPIKIDYIEGGKRQSEIKKKYELVHTHTARRTGATLMYLSGMDFYDIMKITGHATIQNLKKYIKADELEVLEKLVDKYDYFK